MKCNSQTHHTGCECHEARWDAELAKIREERDELKALHEQAVKLVMPGECDSSDAYLKILQDLKEERDAYREALGRGDRFRFSAALKETQEFPIEG